MNLLLIGLKKKVTHKMSKKSNKKQGDQASGASLSDSRQVRDPRTMERGIGSSFATAVARIMDMAPEIAGSKNGFLGVEKQVLDPKENMHSSILPKELDAKKKLNE